MAQLGRLTERPRRLTTDAVVRPLSRVAQRPCARPACPAPSRATLSFDYRLREAWIDPLADESDPGSYDLCMQHVARTRAPYGWRLRDRRSTEEQASDTPPVRPADFGSERTVAVLAAALRSVPSPAPESGGTGRMSEIAREDAGDHAPGGGPAQRSATGVAVGVEAAYLVDTASTRPTPAGWASVVALSTAEVRHDRPLTRHVLTVESARRGEPLVGDDTEADDTASMDGVGRGVRAPADAHGVLLAGDSPAFATSW